MSEPPEKVDVSSLKDTFLECPVCVEHFNQTDRRPRLLHSCLHAFCTQCLQQLLDKEGNGEITCPLCRRIEKVSGTAQMMAIDPVRDQLVEYLHIQKKKQVLCKDCPDGNQARSRCFECGENLCLDCENAHRRNRSTRGHEIKLLGELQAASCESLKVRTFCCNHPDRFIECFCSTCEALCCVMCAIIDHKGHEFQKLDDAAATIIKKIEGSMNEVQDIFKSLSNAKSESGEYVTVVQRDKERSVSEINQKFDAISKRLKHRKETLMGSIEDQSERLIAAANTNGAAFDEGLAEMESTMTYFSNVKTKADNVNILQIQSSLRKKIDHLTHRYGGKEIPKNTERCHFEAQHEENIHQGIDAFGVVRSRGAEGLRMTEPERPAVKKKALGVACQANNHIIKEDTLKLWSLDEISDLKKIEQECGVSITANKTLGRINLHGLKHNISNANGKVYEMIRELDRKRKEEEYADELQRVVQWSFVELTEEGKDKVVDYDKKVNVMLERAFTKQQRTKLEYEGYTFDFTKWVEYPSEDATDTVTMLRRDKVPEVSAHFPGTWVGMNSTDDVKILQVQIGNSEFTRVHQTFTDAVGNMPVQIRRIDRVQSKTLYQQYLAKKQRLEKQNPGTTVERTLWHGTAQGTTMSIMAYGFNKSYCDKDRNALGAGVYFTSDAACAARDRYAPADGQGNRHMFLCKVLTGSYTQGQPQIQTPPQKNPAKQELYDSVVDDPANPKTFVVFSDTQAYPEYLISFK